MRGPLPRWKRADILDRAARLLTEREEKFAQIIAAEAAKPIRTARPVATGSWLSSSVGSPDLGALSPVPRSGCPPSRFRD